MTVTKARDWREKTDEELAVAIAERKKSIFDFRCGGAMGEGANVKEGRELRRDIARIKTVLSARTKTSV